MPLSPHEKKRHANRVAHGVVREVMLRDTVAARPRWPWAAVPFVVAAMPGLALVTWTGIALPLRELLAVALTAALGLGIVTLRLRRKLKAAVQLLELREQRQPEGTR